MEMFARGSRAGWSTWGDQAEEYAPSWPTYANHSAVGEAVEAKSLGSNVAALKDVRGAASLSVLPPKKNKKFKLPNLSEPSAELPLVGGQSKPTGKKPKKRSKKAA